MYKLWFKSQSIMIRIRCILWFELYTLKFSCFVSALIDSKLGLWVIQSHRRNLIFFKFFKIAWDFTSHITWIDITYGSCFTSSRNWLKSSWLKLKYNNQFMHAKKNWFKLDSEMMCNYDGDSINESKWGWKR